MRGAVVKVPLSAGANGPDWDALDGLQAVEGRSTAQVDSIPGDASTTAAINPSQDATSSVEFGWVNTPGDADWYRMPVTAGMRYTIMISGYSSTSGGGPALTSPFVRVYDAAGQLIGSGSGFNGGAASYQMNASENGFVYVSAEGANDATGRYSTMVIVTDAPRADEAPGDASTNATLGVGASVDGSIDTPGDTDWFRVQLTAGTVYEFTMNATSGSAVDPLLQLRDAAGLVLTQNDDFGDGLDSRLTFVPRESGTYYLAAQDYGSGTGAYRLSGSLGAYNDIRTTIDWGTRVEGQVIEVYFVPAGETRDGHLSAGWNDYEIGRAMAALAAYEAITPLDFVRVSDPLQADFKLMTTNSLSDGEFGYFYAPGEPNAGLGVFSRSADGWDEAGGGGLEAGGLGFVTLVHEIGHGLGLAHPHDDGGTSTVMTGVNGPFDSYGAFDLNQGVFTTTTYNDGWRTGPDGRSPSMSYGLQAGPMALDIAVLQTKYGANTSFHTGDDLYVLPGVSGLGSGYLSIWDAGGRDTIEHRGNGPAVIDLRPATIDYSPTGGGVVSHAGGVHGGFTIAAGVVIENAVGGFGADTLRGNAADNALFGRDGDDALFGGAGADHMVGDDGADRHFGEDGDDLIGGAAGDDLIDGGNGRDTLYGDGGRDHMVGGSDGDAIRGGDDDDLIGGQDGDDFIDGGNGRDNLYGDAGADHIVGGIDGDRLFGGDGDDLIGGQDGDDFVDGGNGRDRLYGDGGGDHMIGGSEDDGLFGQDGDDLMGGQDGHDFIDGGNGRDSLYGDVGNDHMVGGIDGDRLFGGDGDDLIGGQDGDDFIAGDAGRDSLYGDAGADHMIGGADADALFGQDGDDLIGGSDGEDFIDGGNGRDHLFGDAGFDHMIGGIEDDRLHGQDGDDLIGGQDGNDYLEGGQGRDALYGDAGDDFFFGGIDNDRLDGGAGLDTAAFTGARSAYTVTAGEGFITVAGADGTDTLFGIERLQFDDVLVSLAAVEGLMLGDDAWTAPVSEAVSPTLSAWVV